MTEKYLRRYTSLPVLLDMLTHERITLLDPASWEDRNDSFYIEKYRELKGLKTVLALCFTERLETFHHWKVFAGDPSGFCIRFNSEKLLACFQKKTGIRSSSVEYRLDEHNNVENPLRDQLFGLGWEIIDLVDKQTPAHTFRENFTEVVMPKVLREKVNFPS